jgi:catechol 2,3-dioxygenase-like lactoylglutathione lyase family enzyme
MLRFYRDALGFTPCAGEINWSDNPQVDQLIDVPRSAARSVMLKAANCRLELFQYVSPPPESMQPLRPYDRGYTHLCVETDEIEADIERLKSCGMSFTDRDFVTINDVKVIYGYDPEGNIIEVKSCSAENRQRPAMAGVT